MIKFIKKLFKNKDTHNREHKSEHGPVYETKCIKSSREQATFGIYKDGELQGTTTIMNLANLFDEDRSKD